MQKAPNPSKILSEAEALNRAASLCSQRECCVSEIELKLTNWGQPEAVQQRIIDRLIKEKYIDEARFCRAYALDKMRYNHWGRIKISQMLRLLGVPDSDRENALAELPEEEYIDILQHLIQQKLPTIKGRSNYERNGKLLRFLAGRGFETSLACDFLNDDL